MYKTIADIDPNEIVTKSYLRDVLKDQLEEYERHVGMLTEDFQDNIRGVIKILMDDREKILEHDIAIKELQKRCR